MNKKIKFKVKQKIKKGLENESSRLGRFRAFDAIRPGMKKMVARYPELREKLRGIKEYSINNLPQLIEQTKKSLEENGCKVFIAKNPEEAREYIESIVKKGLVVKSKTNAGKEIDITRYLEEKGAKVVETDLGDRINQLAKSGASHSLAPAIHIPIERVTELFSKETDEPLQCDAEELVRAARVNLRKYLEEADVGISGANAIVAETGSIFVTENEGNIRAVTSMPKIHIAVAGVEKIVPKLCDGVTVVKAAASYGVGQDIGTYVSVISGPGNYSNNDLDFLGCGQGPEEVHVVLLANGRFEALENGFGESLYCINCGSCLNFCPVYSEIGEQYGYKYLGGRGTVFTAFHADLKKAQEAGLFLCIGCQKCQESCAVGINTPELVLKLRTAVVNEEGLEWSKKQAFKILARNELPKYIKLARSFQDLLLSKKENGREATLRFDFNRVGLPKDRLIPTISTKTFSQMVEGRKKVSNPKMRIGLFAGCVVNYIKPELGIDLLDIFTLQGIEVITFKEEACCGLPALMSGSTQEFKENVNVNLQRILKEDIEHLVFLCPSCATTVKNEWYKALSNDSSIKAEYEGLSDKVIDVSDFLINVLNIEPPKEGLSLKVTYHDPCHLVRGLGIKEEPRKLITSIPGIDFKEMKEADSCCGFGGTFSINFYELSRQVNKNKIKNIEDTGAECVVTGCPGCMIHLRDGINYNKGQQNVLHLVQLLAHAYRGGDRDE